MRFLLNNSTGRLRAVVLLFLFALFAGSLCALPQDIAGGANALLGQDIIGGAAVVFKRPQQARDVVGGAAALIARHRAPRRLTEIARNRPVTPAEPVTPVISNDEKAEMLITEGNAFYDARQYEKAIEAYKDALT